MQKASSVSCLMMTKKLKYIKKFIRLLLNIDQFGCVSKSLNCCHNQKTHQKICPKIVLKMKAI